MTLDASGNLLVGTTSLLANASYFATSPGNAWSVFAHANGTASGVEYVKFYYNNGQIGSITQNGTTAVAYNTSSDYRLKENIAPMTGALAKVAALKPCTYTWKVDGSDGEGFIAHELAEVVPQCVTGEKDAVDADGNPKYQGVDTSFLVATLTAAIKEQQALIESLTSRVVQLEGA
ncbi:MAG: tail fiber domain-containing protein [Micrococcales bacterium]|nr:tail fiber domain-containing protein [Micrococcales bacterium]